MIQPSAADVLVVIDMQNGFCADPESAHVIPVVVDLVDRWSQAGGSVLFTRYWNYAGSPYTRLIGWHKMMARPETDIVQELDPYLDRPGVHILDKGVYTAFTDDGRKLFHEHGWTNPFVIGVDTESCVATTAVDAFELDLTPKVITDACASHAGPDVHRAGLLVMGRNLGGDQLITIADLDKLFGTSRTSSMSP